MKRRRNLNGRALLLESVTGIERGELVKTDADGDYIDPAEVRAALRADGLEWAGEEIDSDECN